MGGTRWSDDSYAARSSYRAETHTPVFDYHEKVTSGKAKGPHDSLNVKNVAVRESRDSEANPNSRAVAVLLDVTGSMRQVPSIVQANLPKLMGLLQRKGYINDPHILVGAIGDAYSDSVPLQIGQFEAGIEIDNDISNLYLEGRGGDGLHESYELGMYFIARHTSIDCFEKRGEKGYLFIIGDEPSYTRVSREQVEKLIGDSLQADLSIEQLISELNEKYNVFFVIPKMTNHYGSKTLEAFWEALLPQQVLKLEDPSGICELIASTIGAHEGFDLEDITENMTSTGTSLVTANAVAKAISRVVKNSSLTVPTSSSVSGLE